jgi:Reverse transcriptase (RNA-dependent DNA polymerase)
VSESPLATFPIGKLVGEVVRLLLEAYYEPQFSARSHGFRPGRGCHTALREIANTWTGTTWFIEGDISDCFTSLDHEVMVEILAEKIHDNRFLRLIRNMLTAGYLEDWKWNATLSGVPQGGVVSPVLSNIYLHKLDTYVETVLIPQHHPAAKPWLCPGDPRTGAGTPEREPGTSPDTASAAARPALRGSARPGLPEAALLPVRRRSPPGFHRAEGRGRGDQRSAGGVPA